MIRLFRFPVIVFCRDCTSKSCWCKSGKMPPMLKACSSFPCFFAPSAPDAECSPVRPGWHLQQKPCQNTSTGQASASAAAEATSKHQHRQPHLQTMAALQPAVHGSLDKNYSSAAQIYIEQHCKNSMHLSGRGSSPSSTACAGIQLLVSSIFSVRYCRDKILGMPERGKDKGFIFKN